jgi:hypothetical protein
MIVAAVTAPGQDNSCFPHCYKCTAVVLERQNRVVTSIDFKPFTGEEELTNKVLKVPGTELQVHASVFFTDESLASNVGRDSIQLALAVAKNSQTTANIVNNAVGEATLSTLDTLRIVAPFTSGTKTFVAALECRAPAKSEDKSP